MQVRAMFGEPAVLEPEKGCVWHLTSEGREGLRERRDGEGSTLPHPPPCCTLMQ
jgi:hypothetical protein